MLSDHYWRAETCWPATFPPPSAPASVRGWGGTSVQESEKIRETIRSYDPLPNGRYSSLRLFGRYGFRNSGSRLFVYGGVESNRQPRDSQARKAALYTNEAKYSSTGQYDKTGQYPHCCSFHPCMMHWILLHFLSCSCMLIPVKHHVHMRKEKKYREIVSISHWGDSRLLWMRN